MKPKIIKTAEEHEAALAHLESLMDAEPGSKAEEELELWSLLVEQYEKEHFPIGDPDPIEAIRFRMDQLGLRQRDLVEYIGPKSKVSEVLNRKRPLSLSMIRGLHVRLGIPAATLVQETMESVPLPGGTAKDKRSRSGKKRVAKS
jgi:HTH-type transcriptional regulator/antitoxin HigA